MLNLFWFIRALLFIYSFTYTFVQLIICIFVLSFIMYPSTHIFVYSFIGVFNPSLIQVFIPLLICELIHLIAVSHREHLVATSLAAGVRPDFLPPEGTHRLQAGLHSLKLRSIFSTLQIKWVLTESSKVRQTAGRNAEAGSSVF